MPPSLLASQLETLEPLGPDEPGWTVDATPEPADDIAESSSKRGCGPA